MTARFVSARRLLNQSLRIAVAGATLSGAGIAPAIAAENGIGFYLLGGRGPMAGYIPPPGVYLQNDVYFYSGSSGGNKRFPAGGQITADVDATIWADFVTGSWVLPQEILGGNLALGLIVPFGRPDVSADILVSPANFAPVERRVTDDALAFGDPVLSAALGWHSGNWHWNITGLLNVPVGDYREGEIANLAFHRWAGDISGAVTWLDAASGLELSAVAGLTFNGTNDVTNYTTGTEFHVEWAATKALTKQLSIGLVGYHYDQITGDSGPGARLGPYEGRVTALGGTIAYNFEVGQTPVSARIKVYREFGAVNRLEGTAGYFTLAFPLAVTEAKPTH
ncbi:transporter [Ancylobacter sp. 6x-1]|uniref:Transporter n=1 Tax=Ancylobacter crimeensis TaxID=2579147 RepID=A0ABT0DEZ4_9HYPH|nr:transporter [Ancylobacter crimeensis]MCK0198541.1 transporter [Ancylobacter crimeensis]